MTDQSGWRLYDVATQQRLSRRLARQFAAIVAGVAVVCGAMIGGLHYEELPFFASWLGYCDSVRYLADCAYPRGLDWAAGMAAALVMGLMLAPLVPVYRRRVKPSVYCRGCASAGWIEDLIRTEGRCPHCGSYRFDHQTTELDPIYHADTGTPLFLPRGALEKDVAGPELLRRFRAAKGKAGPGDRR